MSEDINAKAIERMKAEQVFYGWFDDPTQIEPSYTPPLGGPCPLCGHHIIVGMGEPDIRTHNLMYAGPVYGKRSYFYRTHRTCAEKDDSGTGADGFILDMIKRNGD